MRAKWMDPDYRQVDRDRACIRCGRAISRHRGVSFWAWHVGPWIVHPDDADEGDPILTDESGVKIDVEGMEMLCGEIGATCAKTLGPGWIEWVFRRAW